MTPSTHPTTHEAAPTGAASVIPDEVATFQSGDRVRVINDPSRDGRHVGRTGRICSNTLGGIVWVHVGTHYANFHQDHLERHDS